MTQSISHVWSVENEAGETMPAGIHGNDGVNDLHLLALDAALRVRSFVNEVIAVVTGVGGRMTDEKAFTVTPFTDEEILIFEESLYANLCRMADEDWVEDDMCPCCQQEAEQREEQVQGLRLVE